MATAAQIAANRANAEKSTGPTSSPGKAASGQNARKHGLAGTTTAALIDSASDRALMDDRKALWRPSFRPVGPEEEGLFETLVAESIRVERARDAYFALCRDHGEKARLGWDADRRREADELALKLARAPHCVARKLEGTRQGAELKLDLWRGLAASLETHRDWTEPQRSLALDLLGIHPELRDATTPVDPAAADPFETRRALVAAEVARLEGLRDDRLAYRDDAERAMAEATVGAELTRPLQLMHRYERAAWSRKMWAWRRLDAARTARATEPAPAPAPSAFEPAPRPADRPRPVPPPPPKAPPVAPARPAVGMALAAIADTPEPALLLNRRQRRAQAAMARCSTG